MIEKSKYSSENEADKKNIILKTYFLKEKNSGQKVFLHKQMVALTRKQLDIPFQTTLLLG